MSPSAILPEQHDDDFIPIWSAVQPAAPLRSCRRARDQRPAWKGASGNDWEVEYADGTIGNVANASGGAGVTCVKHDNLFKVDDNIPDYVPADFSNPWADALEDWILESMRDLMAKLVTYLSGSDATEAAMKLVIQYFSLLEGPGHKRKVFIARQQSYHGATLFALGASGHDVRKDTYKTVLSQNVRFVSACDPYRNQNEDESDQEYVNRLASELEDQILQEGPEQVAGFLVEPVVGAALGCAPAVPGYLQAMKDVCQKYGVLFIVDEIMCGMGRTGFLHAWQAEGVVPDVQLIGKTLSGGFYPMSGMIVGHKIFDTFDRNGGFNIFNHGHTYQNSAKGSAVVLAVQKYIQAQGLLKRVRMKGPELGRKLKERLEHHRYVGNIRGVGYFWGILFVQDKTSKRSFEANKAVAKGIKELGLTKDHGIYIYSGSGSSGDDSGDHVMFMPAYNTTDAELDLMIDRLVKLIEAFFDEFDSKSASRLC